VCSTDDPVIAKAAQTWGADVPFTRPSLLSTDEATTLQVVRHSLEALGEQFEMVVVLQCTSPLTEPEDLLGAYELSRQTGEPVISVCAAEHPVEWHFRMDGDGRLTPARGATEARQRQQAQPAYRPNGAVFVAPAAQVAAAGFWTPQTRGFVMPAQRSVDIDSATDLAVAEAMLTATPVPTIELAGRRIGPGHPCFVIAEAGVNHNGSVELALRFVDAVAQSGADAVKFQTFRAEEVISETAPLAAYQQRNIGKGETQLDMARRLQLNEADYWAIRDRCSQRGILFLSTPFDPWSVDLLAKMGVPAFKVASGELTNHPLLAHMAAKGLPLLISTGMADGPEVAGALDAVRLNGNPPLALLHCVSNYPASPEDSNLSAMSSMRKTFRVPVGWSDHTLGIHVGVAAAALGADLIEKHLTLDCNLPGPDHRASIEPADFTALVRAIRDTRSALGAGQKVRRPSEDEIARVARRSLFTARDLPLGRRLADGDLKAIRPGTGISPDQLPAFIGRRLVRALRAGVLLRQEDVE
jgi:N-acetylneuraminate synthase